MDGAREFETFVSHFICAPLEFDLSHSFIGTEKKIGWGEYIVHFRYTHTDSHSLAGDVEYTFPPSATPKIVSNYAFTLSQHLSFCVRSLVRKTQSIQFRVCVCVDSFTHSFTSKKSLLHLVRWYYISPITIFYRGQPVVQAHKYEWKLWDFFSSSFNMPTDDDDDDDVRPHRWRIHRQQPQRSNLRPEP